MRFESRTFSMSKDSEFPDEYQDACYLDPKRGLAAIADGVSSAIFSGPWARILTEAAVVEPPQVDDMPSFQDWLARQRARWAGQIDTSRLTWFQKPKMVDGAMSTLLWIELAPLATDGDEPSAVYRLRGWAIGDCCLFQLRDGRLVQKFPMATAADFGLNPAVLGSVDRKYDHLIEFHTIEGECRWGDLVVLCTDAIALWAMKLYEAEEAVAWEGYWDKSDEAWREEIFAHRESNSMRFDDSTLILLRPVVEIDEPIDADEAEPAMSAEILADLSEAATAAACELTALENAALAETEAERLGPRVSASPDVEHSAVPAPENARGASENDTMAATEAESEDQSDEGSVRHPSIHGE